MAMKLERLETLHQDMITQNILKTRFIFNFRNLQFSVIYIAEEFPQTLLFGCVAHNLFFVLDVDEQYQIKTFLGDNYRPLLDALNLEYDPNNHFSPNVFFEEFRIVIPLHTNPNNTPSITEIAVLRRDVDEEDRIHFCGWRTHDGITSNATTENLSKTQKICGRAAYEVCRAHNISSRWTDDKSLAKPYYPPNA